MNSNKIIKHLFKKEETEIATDVPVFEKPKQAVIIGGGFSKAELIKKGLWERIKNKFTCCINYDYRYFPNPTFLTFVDIDFYKDELNKLKSLPLIIGKYHKNLEKIKHPNTYMLQVNDSKYTRNLSEGVYKSSLAGLFSLSLMIYLLTNGTVFLIGFDQGNINGKKDSKNRWITHSYQGEINHRGIAKINYYNTKGRADNDFAPFAEEKKIKIYNVSPDSRINTFKKINYDEFFKKLDGNTFDQISLRQYIKTKLKGKIL